ncbi:GmrSD restriction endonuclease domain-containing protein [Rhodococcus kronopolitis]|uniref:DUF1524 domain-containing protein n=1 Tax=Rhodococcus kronopolitis TaxID=1460226 RepID=A0ABV9FX57_9NOCA
MHRQNIPSPVPAVGPTRTRTRLVASIVGAACVAAALSACTPEEAPRPAATAEVTEAPATTRTSTTTAATTTYSTVPTEPSPTAAPPETGAATPEAAAVALSALAALPVKGRAAKTGYDRALFGQTWSDDVTVDGGHNGCDTRNDILRRDLTGVALKPGTSGCTVLTGTLADAYTGTAIPFTRGQGTSTAVQVDHVVALSDAWQKGAQQLDEPTLRNFANDPRNLQAVDGPTNLAKGDGDAATWLPPNKAYRCTYVARQVEVKAAYGLWVTAAERDAIARVLTSCGGGEPAPVVPAASDADDDRARHPAPVRLVDPAPAPAPEPDPEPAAVPQEVPAAEPSTRTYYANCSAVRAAGADPIYAGQPGYSGKLDGDGDGVACE